MEQTEKYGTQALMKDFDGILVGEYIEGREVAITILENEGGHFLKKLNLFFRIYQFKYQAYTLKLNKESV